MPIYIFACEDCGNTYEINASIKEKEAGLRPKCPQCFGEHSRQLITAGFSIRSGNGGGNMPFGGCGPAAGPGCCG
jgi:putative FmdB family regulatory protein